MKDIAISHVNTKLLEYTDKYATIYPQYSAVAVEYQNSWDKMMQVASNNFASQPLRDGAVRQQMITEQNEVFTKYNELACEVRLLETLIRVYIQLSKNLISRNFGNE